GQGPSPHPYAAGPRILVRRYRGPRIEVASLTLTTRLSLFFLSMLGMVLVGFSATLYLLARVYLYQQTEERLDAVMNTLVAALEIGPEGVEWEPAERQLSLGHEAFGDRIVWQVADKTGRIVDRSKSAETAALFASISPPKAPEVSKTVSWQ